MIYPKCINYCEYSESIRDKFQNVFPTVFQVKLCSVKYPIIKILVSHNEDKNSVWWAWFNSKKQEYDYIWPNKWLTEVCTEDLKNKDNELVPVKIEIIGPITKEDE